MYSKINEQAAIKLLSTFISLKELITAAMNGFAENDSVKDKENADICYKAIKSFLSE